MCFNGCRGFALNNKNPLTICGILCSFADHLMEFDGVFIFKRDSSPSNQFGRLVSLHPLLKTPEDRTIAVGQVVKCLGEELIPDIRNEV